MDFRWHPREITVPSTVSKKRDLGPMKLNDMRVRNANLKDKPYKLTDGHGLYLLIKSTSKAALR